MCPKKNIQEWSQAEFFNIRKRNRIHILWHIHTVEQYANNQRNENVIHTYHMDKWHKNKSDTKDYVLTYIHMSVYMYTKEAKVNYII